MNPGTLEPWNNELLSKKMYAKFDGGNHPRCLSDHCHDLLLGQRESWQKLKDAYGVLRTLRTRKVPMEAFSVLLYHNPGRLTSATAAVGQKDVKERPCFLCAHNLPSGQKGILYREEYMILCNPMPVFPSHLTVAHVEHRPQAISEVIDTFLVLMADLGDRWITLYNGPRCGASAPDHLHFQALPAGHMPVEQEILDRRRFSLVAKIDGVLLYRANDLGREIIVLEGDSLVPIAQAFARVIAALKKALPAEDEPMVNLVGFFKEGGSRGLTTMDRWQVLIFPRKKHRPDSYSKEGDERIVVSPGAVEMAGILVTPMERDFERLEPAAVQGIYSEVSLDRDTLTRVLGAIE